MNADGSGAEGCAAEDEQCPRWDEEKEPENEEGYIGLGFVGAHVDGRRPRQGEQPRNGEGYQRPERGHDGQPRGALPPAETAEKQQCCDGEEQQADRYCFRGRHRVRRIAA